MRLRPATPEDVGLLQHWDTQPHVIAAAPNDNWRWETELLRPPAWRQSLIGEVDGRPIGFLEIIDPFLEDTHHWGDCGPGLRAIDIWIGEADDLGRGYGAHMMLIAIERCLSDPAVKGIVVDPLAGNDGARRFFARLGFRHEEDRWFDEDYCAVHLLRRWTPGSGTQVADLSVREADDAEVRVLQQSILRPEGPLPADRPAPADAVDVGAFDGPTVVGAATILPAHYPGPGALEEPHWQLRGMVVRGDWRGSGVGLRVMEAALAAARDRGAAGLWAAARTRALGFYERAGWTVAGSEWFKPGVGPHRWVTRSS